MIQSVFDILIGYARIGFFSVLCFCTQNFNDFIISELLTAGQHCLKSQTMTTIQTQTQKQIVMMKTQHREFLVLECRE